MLPKKKNFNFFVFIIFKTLIYDVRRNGNQLAGEKNTRQEQDFKLIKLQIKV
jgi:hypothetical protein